MRIDQISYAGIGRGLTATLALPPNGITTITGPNGSGKSSFIEAVAFAMWGKTLRGTSPWPAGQEGGRLQVATSLAHVERMQGARAFKWSVPGADPVKYESPTKAQEKLVEVVGSLDLWRRTSVFSSSDADNWTKASNGERLKLVERLLGVDRIDKALEHARKKLRAKEGEHTAATQKVALLLTEKQGVVQRLKDQRQRLSEAQQNLTQLAPAKEEKDQAAINAEIKRLGEQAQKARDDRRDVLDRLAHVGDRVAQIDAQLKERQKHQRLLLDEKCPICEQQIPEALREREGKEIDRLMQESITEARQAAENRKTLEAEAQELEEDRQTFESRKQAKGAELTEARGITDANRIRTEQEKRFKLTEESARTTVAQLEQEEIRIAKDITEAEPVVKERAREVAVLKAAVEVLGMKGPRLSMVARALVGLGKAMDLWLHKVSRGALAVRLAPDRQSADGGVISEITQAIRLAPDETWRDFESFSGGERQRMNAASTMALAEVGRATHGVTGGTVFFDEVWDALDDDGVYAVCEALAELAESTSVVVISHNPQLVQRLPAVQRVRLGA